MASGILSFVDVRAESRLVRAVDGAGSKSSERRILET